MSLGIQANKSNRFYVLSTKIEPPIHTKANPFIFQYTVKFEQVMDCGGGYVKLLNENFDQDTFGGDSAFLLMFGPDICGPNNRILVTLSLNGKSFKWKKTYSAPNDKLTHIYTLALYPNDTYSVLLDANTIAKGQVFEDWDFDSLKYIPDQDDKKPAVNNVNSFIGLG